MCLNSKNCTAGSCYRKLLVWEALLNRNEIECLGSYKECSVLTCDGGEFEQVSVQVDVHPGTVVGQGDTGAVPPDSQVLMETEDQTSQSNLNRLSPGKGTSPPGVVLHQHLVKKWKI